MGASLFLNGLIFEWDEEKSAENLRKHDIPFRTACEVFLDPFVQFVDASPEDEAREAAIGLTSDFRLLFVVHIERYEGIIRIISARKATSHERRNHEENE